MARDRARRARGSGRRTNWIGAVKVDSYQTIAPGDVVWFDWFAAQFTGEARGYVDPTLVRLRGHVVYDPVVGAIAASQFGVAYCLILVAPPALTTQAPYVSMSPEDDAWSSDRIIWTGCHAWGTVVSDVADAGVTNIPSDVRVETVDSEAMRVLKDDQRIMVGFYNSDLSSTSCSFTADFRALLME